MEDSGEGGKLKNFRWGLDHCLDHDLDHDLDQDQNKDEHPSPRPGLGQVRLIDLFDFD